VTTFLQFYYFVLSTLIHIRYASSHWRRQLWGTGARSPRLPTV